MTSEQITVRIAGYELTVPVFEDEATTRQIAKRVSQRIREIEAQSRRVDTHMFALRAAYSYACDLAALRNEAAEDEREFLRIADQIGRALREVIEELKETD